MIENTLKKLIIEKYGSIRQFSQKIDVPYTTIDTILKRGIDNSNVLNIIKICKELKISTDELVDNHKIVFLYQQFDSEKKNDEITFTTTNNTPLMNKYKLLYNKLKDLPEYKQEMVINVTESIMNEIDKKTDK